ncbi:hypothetical protein HAX54_053146 [Datura stramonium]|uniref:Uncharacterized protein n=1 Tax=Datura stramonium TaxID=4076 RepID=A0ABS8T250_DATST|nr:hypothetical protein [Datura stramonium]
MVGARGYNSIENAPTAKFQDSEPPRVEVPPSTDADHLDNPYRVFTIYSYHEARTLPDRWIVTSTSEALLLPPNPLMSCLKDIASRDTDGLVLHSD